MVKREGVGRRERVRGHREWGRKREGGGGRERERSEVDLGAWRGQGI